MVKNHQFIIFGLLYSNPPALYNTFAQNSARMHNFVEFYPALFVDFRLFFCGIFEWLVL